MPPARRKLPEQRTRRAPCKSQPRRNPTSTLLLALNRDYIRSVQNSDVRRFNEMLAEDFFCSNPDGSLVDRRGFLKQTSVPVKISNLEAHEVQVRILGDFAIIHARTSYSLPDGAAGKGALYRRVGAPGRASGSRCPRT